MLLDHPPKALHHHGLQDNGDIDTQHLCREHGYKLHRLPLSSTENLVSVFLLAHGQGRHPLGPLELLTRQSVPEATPLLAFATAAAAAAGSSKAACAVVA